MRAAVPGFSLRRGMQVAAIKSKVKMSSKRRYVILCATLVALFALADVARGEGFNALGAVLDAGKMLVCATLLVAAWRSGLRLLAVVGMLLFSVTA